MCSKTGSMTPLPVRVAQQLAINAFKHRFQYIDPRRGVPPGHGSPTRKWCGVLGRRCRKNGRGAAARFRFEVPLSRQTTLFPVPKTGRFRCCGRCHGAFCAKAKRQVLKTAKIGNKLPTRCMISANRRTSVRRY